MRSPSFVAAILRSVRDEQRPQRRDDNDGGDERQRYDATVVDAIENGLNRRHSDRRGTTAHTSQPSLLGVAAQPCVSAPARLITAVLRRTPAAQLSHDAARVRLWH